MSFCIPHPPSAGQRSTPKAQAQAGEGVAGHGDACRGARAGMAGELYAWEEAAGEGVALTGVESVAGVQGGRGRQLHPACSMSWNITGR